MAMPRGIYIRMMDRPPKMMPPKIARAGLQLAKIDGFPDLKLRGEDDAVVIGIGGKRNVGKAVRSGVHIRQDERARKLTDGIVPKKEIDIGRKLGLHALPEGMQRLVLRSVFGKKERFHDGFLKVGFDKRAKVWIQWTHAEKRSGQKDVFRE